MNPILSLNLIRYNAVRVLDFCTDSNVLRIKFEDTEKQINLASVTNARIIKKQRSYIKLYLLLVVCVCVNVAIAAVFVKAILTFLTVFVSIIQPVNSHKLLLNYRGGAFSEIPLQKKDLEIANKVIVALSKNR